MIWELTYFNAVYIKERVEKDCEESQPATNETATLNDSTTVEPAVKKENHTLSGPSVKRSRVEIPPELLRASSESSNDSTITGESSKDSTTVESAIKKEGQSLSGPPMKTYRNLVEFPPVPLRRLSLPQKDSRATSECPNDSTTVEPAVKQEDQPLSGPSVKSIRKRIEIPRVPLPRLPVLRKRSRTASESGCKKAESSTDTTCVEKSPSLRDLLAMTQKEAKDLVEAVDASGPAQKRRRK